MSTPTAQPLPSRQSGRPWGPGRVIALVCGSLLALIALGLALAGIVLVLAHATARDATGFYTSPTGRFTTSTFAITAEGMQIGEVRSHGADPVLDAIGATIRVRASAPGGRPVFIGIAPKADVNRYLARSAHTVVSNVASAPFNYDAVRRGGPTPPAVPSTQTFWSATASGDGTQAVTWKPSRGRWAIVVMNADASRSVSADVSVGAKTGVLLPIGVVLFALGVFGLAGSGGIVWMAAREPSGPGGGATPAVAPAATDEPYPLHFKGRLDEPLSRGLWLVKWLLALPHWIVLAFLWIAYDVLTLIALVAILFTGRYPRPLFDFNVGVLRWTWRVVHYALTFGTDRYPPFTLTPTDYPAELDVPYPERLSRGKAFFKPWLLSLPHWFVVAFFLGWWSAPWANGQGGPPGLIAVLAVIGGVALLFSGRYPRDIHGVVVGMARWVARVVVYAGLMRDEYPPFRLDR